LIPNQGVLINAIVLQEAKLSSEIENVVTTNDELYRAFADAGQLVVGRYGHVGHMFAEPTYARDMSKKSVYFDRSRKHVEGANMWARVSDPHLLYGFARHLMWRDSRIAPLRTRSPRLKLL